MIYGYARISTKKQFEGNGLEIQIQELLKEGILLENIFQEQYTGTKLDRPSFIALISTVKEGDRIVVTKLDRFARNTLEGLAAIQELLARGVSIHILNMGLIDNTPTGKLILTVFFAFAEFERSLIVERTQAGKEIAKTKDGFKEGRPCTYTDYQINNALFLLESNSYKEVEKMTGISKSTLIRAKKKVDILAI